jgi:hypothetical protein
MLEQAREREVDAVRRRAVDVLVAVRGDVDRQAAVERERVGGAARVLLGSDDVEVAEALRTLSPSAASPGAR